MKIAVGRDDFGEIVVGLEHMVLSGFGVSDDALANPPEVSFQ